MHIRKIVLNAIALVGLVGISLIAHADDRKDIDALYSKVGKAMEAKDINGILATGTKDFTYTEAGKTMTGEQVSAQMKEQFKAVKGPMKSKLTVVSCKITGKTAMVISTDYSEMQVPGQDGKSHKVVTTGKSKDVVVKTDKGWLMKSVNVLSSSMTMDGKPFDPAKSMPDHK
jgi:ketosteroid isomerase-like protein